MLMLTAIPAVNAYSYEEAMTKIDWNTVKNNTIMLFTKESTFTNSVFGTEKYWTIYRPSKLDFEGFIKSKCFETERIVKNDKKIIVFKETGDCKSTGSVELDQDVYEAYSDLNNGLNGRVGNGYMVKHNRHVDHLVNEHGYDKSRFKYYTI